MIFSWFRNRRRQKLTAKPFPAEWDESIRQNVAHASYLSAEEYARLKQWIQVFVAEKYWEGCEGLVVTDEMKAVIAALAGFLVRKFEDYYYDRLQTILVFPQIVWRTEHFPREGIVNEDPTARLGEALRSGPMSLVWPHVLAGGQLAHDGQNVVFHEFAHVLDMEDQFLDGTPNLKSADLFDRWQRTIKQEYEALVQAVRRGKTTVIDSYGATNPAEFFAVSTECFFEQPQLMAQRHPEWYALLREFYKQDPREFASQR